MIFYFFFFFYLDIGTIRENQCSRTRKPALRCFITFEFPCKRKSCARNFLSSPPPPPPPHLFVVRKKKFPDNCRFLESSRGEFADERWFAAPNGEIGKSFSVCVDPFADTINLADFWYFNSVETATYISSFSSRFLTFGISGEYPLYLLYIR